MSKLAVSCGFEIHAAPKFPTVHWIGDPSFPISTTLSVRPRHDSVPHSPLSLGSLPCVVSSLFLGNKRAFHFHTRIISLVINSPHWSVIIVTGSCTDPSPLKSNPERKHIQIRSGSCRHQITIRQIFCCVFLLNGTTSYDSSVESPGKVSILKRIYQRIVKFRRWS